MGHCADNFQDYLLHFKYPVKIQYNNKTKPSSVQLISRVWMIQKYTCLTSYERMFQVYGECKMNKLTRSRVIFLGWVKEANTQAAPPRPAPARRRGENLCRSRKCQFPVILQIIRGEAQIQVR